MDVRRDGAHPGAGQRHQRAESPLDIESGALPVDRSSPLDVAALAAVLKPGGALARSLPAFEHRPAQVEMLEAVARALNSGLKLIAEAGTGTGKSVAYLIPAIYYSLAEHMPVVISTNTINLQEQLLNKDIPDLLRALPVAPDFSVAVLKGRGNYLCLRRWQAVRHTLPDMDEGVELVPKIAAWAARTSTGDRSELGLRGRQATMWGSICARDGECMGERCGLRQEAKCFVHRARQKARGANLIIVNHALLLADVASDNQLLPRFNHLVVDEAHHLEDVATEQLGADISAAEIGEVLKDVGQALGDVDRIARNARLPPQRRQDVARLVQKAWQAHGEVSGPASDFLRFLGAFVASLASAQDIYERAVRLVESARNHTAWHEAGIAWENLSSKLAGLAGVLGELHTLVEAIPSERLPDVDDLKLRLGVCCQDCQRLRGIGETAMERPDPQTIYWASLERQDAGPSVARPARAREPDETARSLPGAGAALHTAPLEVGPLLDAMLFSRKDAVVLTSATLSSGSSFAYIRGRLGFSADRELQLDSPFDYMSAALLYLPEDVAAPDSQAYQTQVEKSLLAVVPAAAGRTLVLLTSRQALRATRAAIREPLEAQGIRVLGQGLDGSAEQIVASFKADPKAVMLGVASLWEGIDIAGDALSVLVIGRLPFTVPTDPVHAARSELFEDPFHEYSLPQAVLRFKQGFGRLIRSATDRGVAVVLDRRVHGKMYGRVFLEALPACNVRRGPLANLPQVIRHWLASAGQRASA